MFSLRAEGFSCSLDVLYGAIYDQKILNLFPAVNFFQFFTIKTLDPDWIQIRMGIQPKMLDLDPDLMNPDLKHWLLDSQTQLNYQPKMITRHKYGTLES
jgi:hypothetical protein